MNTIDCLYDKNGNVVKMEKNKGLYPTVSKWPHVQRSFGVRGFIISSVAHMAYAPDNPIYKSLFWKEIFSNTDNQKRAGFPMIPICEVEIFPCKFKLVKESDNPEYYDIEIGKEYDGVIAITSSGQKYEQNVNPLIGAEGIPWEKSLERIYTLYGLMNYTKPPFGDVMLEIGTPISRDIESRSVYELRTD